MSAVVKRRACGVCPEIGTADAPCRGLLNAALDREVVGTGRLWGVHPMIDPALIPPPRRPELLVNPLGDEGQHVVKDPWTGAYYNLGKEESFLLLRLDGRQ